jgi:hypothetical protein
MTIYQQWLDAKVREADATAKRREIEDQMVAQFKVPSTLDKTANFEADGFKIKIEGRINRRVNAEKLQEIAVEHGLMAHLECLFRWKPEINAAIWKSTDPAITTPLLDAITSTPGRPSFTIVAKD